MHNTATGYAVNTHVRDGRFFVQGLEVGGPYVVEIRRIGLVPQRSSRVFLKLGESLEIQFVMQPAVIRLEPVRVSGATAPGSSGAATLIPDSLVHRLPTLNRNFFDFVVLAPQVSTKIGFQRSGVSGAGANLRFNNFLISGADERFVNGNVSPAANGRKSIPIDAVREYQVLLAPYDVRYGDFAGALVNTVTQSGTNEFRGSMFGYWRNDRLARGSRDTASIPYERLQYGFSAGGPLLRDRLHFFVAPEFQSLSSPAAGPYVGQPLTQVPSVPVNEADLVRLEEIMRGYGLAAGSGGPVQVRSPLRNLFARLDAAIPQWNSRAIAFVNQARSDEEQFSRLAPDTFYLSSYRRSTATSLRLTSLQVHSQLPRTSGGHNELIVSHIADVSEPIPDVQQPLVRVRVQGTAGGIVLLNAGSAEGAQGGARRSQSFSVRNELSLPLGARHLVVLGVQAERFRIQSRGVSGGFGIWTFASLDALELGVAERYQLRKDLGSAGAPLMGGQYAAYVGDSWRVKELFSITGGVRVDLMNFSTHAPYNPTVDSIFARRTDEMPRARVHFSPRIGFSWDITGEERSQLRGGIGVFTGRPPRAWFRPAVTNHGFGVGLLECGNRPGENLPPPFEPDYRTAPTACATGPALQTAPIGDVDLLDPKLRMAQSLRASLAYDRRLPWDMILTTEALGSRYLSDFIWVNLNLVGPQSTDRFGRVLYGAIGPSGVATPAVRSGFPAVIELRNTSRNYSYQLSTRVERRFSRGFGTTALYTYSRTRDVQSPSRVNMRGVVMWADARAVSGRHDDLARGISLNDVPHRIVGALTYTAPWQRWSTGLSLYYVGESGSPFTYLATGEGRRGDLNADGSNANDPIYVPRSALDPNEIRFEPFTRQVALPDGGRRVDTVSAMQQGEMFDRFIERTPCLRRQRGRILERHSCREPWSHTTIASLRQALPIGSRVLEAELDVFNVLNLLDGRWGRYRAAVPQLLEHVAHTAEAPAAAQPIFRFNESRAAWRTLPAESAFQLQVAMRYRF